jgi:hypothetical protein
MIDLKNDFRNLQVVASLLWQYTKKINICLYITGDMPEYKGAFVLCDDTCRQVKIDFFWWYLSVASIAHP